jgi:hypothetical protein
MTASSRFQMRSDADGWMVFDNWTGLPVVIAGVEQTGIGLQDAIELRELLQGRADKGDRRIHE